MKENIDIFSTRGFYADLLNGFNLKITKHVNHDENQCEYGCGK